MELKFLRITVNYYDELDQPKTFKGVIVGESYTDIAAAIENYIDGDIFYLCIEEVQEGEV